MLTGVAHLEGLRQQDTGSVDMAPPALSITGALTQEKLVSALHAVAGAHWCGGQVQIKGSSHTWEMALYTSDGVTLIAYDNAGHYTDPERIRLDRETKRIAEGRGHLLLRFPYWLQLDTLTLHHFFGLNAEVVPAVPHGFGATSVLPVDFCEDGLRRFIRELQALPRPVGDAVARSLKERAETCGIHQVLPPHLHYLAE